MKNTEEEKILTLSEAFGELVQNRKWHRFSTDISPRMACKDKRTFLDGNLSEKRMRKYLKDAGYIIVQEEKWLVRNINMK
ncbi:hypothetical protein [Parabacteroides sp. PF5-9]|uniref:hypothetical protein n=1 Tax=Parabacteroides sp. PF5-9 TaxID=1742404 RepID=UPI0024761A96|nr:hypothetical protein [Parabacteroides sp. PF5-9]MDH6358940.1 hypothetical protein [Parabacteroides sp. PF5-9]